MWWGGKPKVSAQDRAVLDLKLQRDKIKQYQKRIAGIVAHEHELAKQCLKQGRKDRATVLLRRKKYQQQILAKTDDQLATLQELVSSIEFAQIQKDVVFGLEQGSKVLKELNAQMSIEKIDRIMDDTAEGVAYQQEVSDMLADKITIQEEDEIQDELERMEIEEGLRKNKSQSQVPHLPEAPKTQLESEPEEAQNETPEPLAA